jgi:hypothetical protein
MTEKQSPTNYFERRAVVDECIRIYPKFCSSFTYKLQREEQNLEIHYGGFNNCFLDEKNKLIYMHIDKCASTSISTALRSSYFTDLTFLKDSVGTAKYFVTHNYTFFAVIRDPADRWVSGLNEFIKRTKPPKGYVVSQLEKNRFVFDEHTAPQHLFLRLCMENNGTIKYLKLDDNLSEKVSNLILNSMLKRHDANLLSGPELFEFENFKGIEIPHLRTSDLDLESCKTVCQKLYDTYAKDNSYFKELYQYDYLLYDKAV